MIITISGTPGSGKSTVGKILAKRLDFKRYYMGQMFRDLAKERGITLQELLESGEADESLDRDLDLKQKKIGETEDNLIIEGRTSFLMIPHSIKVYIFTDIETGAKRILNDLKTNSESRNEGELETLEQVRTEQERRMRTDTKRYRKYYDIDVFDPKHYDLLVDTTNITAEEAAQKVIGYLESFDK